MPFYTVEQLGPTQSLTPEGFLLCQDVPIARIGTMDYVAVELPELEGRDGAIVVERTADVLFDPDTIASFEGKSVTIGHPAEPVGPENWAAVSKGIAQNVRRGEGHQSDLMLADLLVMDREAIRRVRSKGFDKLDQVSNGYDAKYEQIAPGRARQVRIVGNHVALVKNARCGSTCSVQDSADNLQRGNDMAKKTGSTSLRDTLRKMFMTKDADGFEQALASVEDEDAGGDAGAGKEVHVHVNLPGAPGLPGTTPTGDDEPTNEPVATSGDKLSILSDAVNKVAEAVSDIGKRVEALEAGRAPTADEEPSGGGEGGDELQPTGDSGALRDLFQDARSRAEILAPGVQLPTFDSKTPMKRTSDAICGLRRRALRGALSNDNAEIVRRVLAGADVEKMTCDAAAVAFNAASELVRFRNTSPRSSFQPTADAKPRLDINERHAKFWSNHS